MLWRWMIDQRSRSIGCSRAIDRNASRWKSFSLIVIECCCSSQPCFAIIRAVGSNCGDIVSVPPMRSPNPATPEQIVADRAARLAEVVEDARLDLLRRVGWEQRPHADRELVLPPQTEREFLIGEIAGVDDAGQARGCLRARSDRPCRAVCLRRLRA